MDDEPILEVDSNDRKKGLRQKREFYTGKYIHRAVHLLLLNSKGEILLQKRAPDKKWYPNLFTFSVSGTVGDESYDECIKHEMREEIGLSIPCREILNFYLKDKTDNAFHQVYIAKSDAKITPDAREISEIRWMKVEELKRSIRTHPETYTPGFSMAMTMLFEKHKDLTKIF